jgi:hypothetical protein
MSGAGQRASAAWRPAGVVMSPALVRTTAPGTDPRSRSAAASSAAPSRAVMVTATPARTR